MVLGLRETRESRNLGTFLYPTPVYAMFPLKSELELWDKKSLCSTASIQKVAVGLEKAEGANLFVFSRLRELSLTNGVLNRL